MQKANALIVIVEIEKKILPMKVVVSSLTTQMNVNGANDK
jgi:DNA recombination-dependent growth factor C